MLARFCTAGAALSSLRQCALVSTKHATGPSRPCAASFHALRTLNRPKAASAPEATSSPFTTDHVLKTAAKDLPNVTPKDMFAVVHVGGTQYKISVDDTIVTQKLNADIGSEIYLNKVLLVGGKEYTLVGAPIVGDAIARVKATVIEQAKTAKVVVYKKKRRKQYQRERGHRQQVTVLKITAIKLEEAL